MVGGVVGLALVVAAGGGAQLAHLPLHHLETSVEGCPASLNLTTSFQLT